MPYITQQDYFDLPGGETELIQLAGDSADYGAVNPVIFDRAVASAESFVNTRLSNLYTIPLTAINDDLKDIILAIVRSKLFFCNETEEVAKNYQEAIKRFSDYVKGVGVIDGAERLNASSSYGATAYKSSAPVFTDELFEKH